MMPSPTQYYRYGINIRPIGNEDTVDMYNKDKICYFINETILVAPFDTNMYHYAISILWSDTDCNDYYKTHTSSRHHIIRETVPVNELNLKLSRTWFLAIIRSQVIMLYMD